MKSINARVLVFVWHMLFDVNTKNMRKTILDSIPCIIDMCEHPVQAFTAASAVNGDVIIINNETDSIDYLQTIQENVPNQVVKWVNDTLYFLVGNDSGDIYFASFESKSLYSSIEGAHKAPIVSIQINKDINQFFTCDSSGIVKVWSFDDFSSPLYTFQCTCPKNSVSDCIWIPRSHEVLVATCGDGLINDLRTTSQTNENGLIEPTYIFHIPNNKEIVRSVAMKRMDKEIFVFYATKSKVYLMEYLSLKFLKEYTASNPIQRVYLHPYLEHLVVLEGNEIVLLNPSSLEIQYRDSVNENIYAVSFFSNKAYEMLIATNTSLLSYQMEIADKPTILSTVNDRHKPDYMASLLLIQKQLSILSVDDVDLVLTTINISPFVSNSIGLQFISDEIIYSSLLNSLSIEAYVILIKNITTEFQYSKEIKKIIFKDIFKYKAVSLLYHLIQQKVFDYDKVFVEARKEVNDFVRYAFSFEYGDPKIDKPSKECEFISKICNEVGFENMDKYVKYGCREQSVSFFIKMCDIQQLSEKNPLDKTAQILPYDAIFENLPYEEINLLSLSAFYGLEEVFNYLYDVFIHFENEKLLEYACAGGNLNIFNECLRFHKITDGCLKQAIIHRSSDIISVIMQSDNEINFVDPEWCIDHKNIEMAIAMLETSDKEKPRDSLALKCIEKGYYPFVIHMIEMNIPLNIGIILSKSIDTGSIPLTQYICETIENPFEYFDENGNACIHKAIINDDKELFDYLLQSGANINYKNRRGETPLILAAKSMDLNDELIEYLVENGADVTLSDNKGNTALHYVVADGDVKIAQYLVEHGADINKENNSFQTVIGFAKNPSYEMKEFLRIYGAKEVGTKKAIIDRIIKPDPPKEKEIDTRNRVAPERHINHGDVYLKYNFQLYEDNKNDQNDKDNDEISQFLQ